MIDAWHSSACHFDLVVTHLRKYARMHAHTRKYTLNTCTRARILTHSNMRIQPTYTRHVNGVFH